MSSLPALGPRGEGWVLLQGIFLALIFVSGTSGPAIPASDAAEAAVLRAVGYISLAAGLAVMASAVWRLREARALRAVPRPSDEGSLVDAGPYRFVRHPIYAGLVLAALGSALARLSWTALVLSVGLFVVLDLKRRREEAWLADRYPEYRSYRARTRALVPFLY